MGRKKKEISKYNQWLSELYVNSKKPNFKREMVLIKFSETDKDDNTTNYCAIGEVIQRKKNGFLSVDINIPDENFVSSWYKIDRDRDSYSWNSYQFSHKTGHGLCKTSTGTTTFTKKDYYGYDTEVTRTNSVKEDVKEYQIFPYEATEDNELIRNKSAFAKETEQYAKSVGCMRFASMPLARLKVINKVLRMIEDGTESALFG